MQPHSLMGAGAIHRGWCSAMSASWRTFQFYYSGERKALRKSVVIKYSIRPGGSYNILCFRQPTGWPSVFFVARRHWERRAGIPLGEPPVSNHVLPPYCVT